MNGILMDTEGDRLWLLAALLGICVLLRGWFTVCETVLTELNDAAVHAQAEQDKSYARLDRLISKPVRLRRSFVMHRVFSAMWIGVLCCGLFAGDLAAQFPIRDSVLLSDLLLTLGTSLLLTALTDLFPKQLGLRAGEKFARLCAGSVRLLIAFWTPFYLCSSGVTAVLCKLCAIPAADAVDIVTEEEIRQLVDAGNETGGIEESQREMINNIFTFDDVPVSDVMTHRKDMSAVPKEAKASEAAALALEEGFSRIPVYDGQIDTILGVLLVKDLLPLVGKADDCPVTELMRPAIFVPDSAKCRDVFQRMRREKMQLAIVSDEYGGTAGMVTMEDLLEEIVGSIEDEYDDEEAELTELSDGVYSIAGSADPEDILPKLGVPFEADDEYDTMSAFVVHLLGRIPQEGERPVAEQDGVRYTLLSYEDNWISRIQAEIIRSETCSESDGKSI